MLVIKISPCLKNQSSTITLENPAVQPKQEQFFLAGNDTFRLAKSHIMHAFLYTITRNSYMAGKIRLDGA
jgi:hypothetical protein